MQLTQNQVTDLVTPAQTLRDAALYISRHGWTTGSFYFDPEADAGLTPAACVVGAIGMVCYGYPCENPVSNFSHPGFPDFEAAFELLARHVASLVDEQPETFNDEFARDAQEVLLTLEAAAEEWEEGQAAELLGSYRIDDPQLWAWCADVTGETAFIPVHGGGAS